ncbi:MAG: NADPH-dependent F420 reductase [Gammaproteobacteria bacterium]|nr:NADPH-dependent F420 reductase [Gammaproteobacteria bacterium]
MSDDKPTIAVIGGTGDLGTGLALRLLRAGYPIVIGSRAADRAATAAAELRERAGTGEVRGLDNAAAAAAADVVIMTVPFASQRPTLEAVRDAVQGKVFVDTTVPLVPPKVMRVQMPASGSAAKGAQELLGEDVRVVSAFQNVAAAHLQDEHARLDDCDVLVCGNDADARAQVVTLAEAMGMRAWHAGPIDNSVVAEALTSVLIFMNKRYKIDGAGIRITGRTAAD